MASLAVRAWVVVAVALAGCAASGRGSGPACTQGAEGCACVGGTRCLTGLSCIGGRCQDPTRPLDSGVTLLDGGRSSDVGPNPDAFFALDPPPVECLPDGGMRTPSTVPGGTPECPDDKNREGCGCWPPDSTAACWPGLRVNRSRGICQDGVTTCQPHNEFTGRWGPCVGHVLPTATTGLGPAACRCFSAGRWDIANLSPCFITNPGVGETIAVSTYVPAGGGTSLCPTPTMAWPPSPEPGTDWSTNGLTVDCEGRFQLCYTLKAGNADTPSPGDCVVARVCTEAWYATRDTPQDFPVLPAWVSGNAACSAAFNTTGGYGEMSVVGLSVECDAVDDGSGGEYVFNRVNYCPSSCSTMPTAPECARCGMGGSGMF